MAENPSNGHPGHAPAENQSAPRVLPPQGARAARALNGSPIEIAPDTTPTEIAPAETIGAESEAIAPDTGAAFSDSPMVSDFREAFALSDRNGDNNIQSDAPDENGTAAPPLGISIEPTDQAEAPSDDYASDEDGTSALGLDSIEGEQLFSGNAETDDATDEVPVSLAKSDDGNFGGGANGGEPPYDGGDSLSPLGAGGARPDTPRDQELGLMEHLRELRSRLIYGILGVMLVMCVTWHFSNELQGWFSAPILKVLNANGVYRGNLISTDPTAFFTLYFQFSLVSALILAAPWVLFQVWRFVEPAMTNSERRYTLVLVPFSSILFFLGAGLGYAVSPLFFQFFLQFQPPGVAAQWKYDDSLLLMAKMLLIFGLAFQVPIIIIFGHKVGLISRNLLIEYWRHAVVVIFIVVAILTPTWDPFTMTACALPPCLLYLLSIWLVKWI